MERDVWYASVYEAVQQCPQGKVTTYGQIAKLLGRREF
jgi:methylated-DNA-protein-cysteine methyltransferase-like protein